MKKVLLLICVLATSFYLFLQDQTKSFNINSRYRISLTNASFEGTFNPGKNFLLSILGQIMGLVYYPILDNGTRNIKWTLLYLIQMEMLSINVMKIQASLTTEIWKKIIHIVIINP